MKTSQKRFTFDSWEIAMIEELVQAIKESDHVKLSRLCADDITSNENYIESIKRLLDKLSKI